MLLSPSGHKKVMQAFDYVRAIMKEKMRFQMMMVSLTNEPVEPAYQVNLIKNMVLILNFKHVYFIFRLQPYASSTLWYRQLKVQMQKSFINMSSYRLDSAQKILKR